jgi:hypothetical protein
MAERNRAFRPLDAEMQALLAEDRRRGRGARDYPALELTPRYLALHKRMEAFNHRYPVRDCQAERLHARAH